MWIREGDLVRVLGVVLAGVRGPTRGHELSRMGLRPRRGRVLANRHPETQAGPVGRERRPVPLACEQLVLPVVRRDAAPAIGA